MLRLHAISYLLLSFILLHATTAQYAWVAYDICANATLYHYLPGSCLFNGTDFVANEQGNACLCPNEAFITDVARYLWTYCSCDVLERSAGTFVKTCNSTGTPATFNVSTIVALGSNQTQGCVDKPVSDDYSHGRTKHRTLDIVLGIVAGILGITLALQVIGMVAKKQHLKPTYQIARLCNALFRNKWKPAASASTESGGTRLGTIYS